MEIIFEKVGNQYVAEFQAPSDFNLHIEREEIGVLEVHQRGSEEGKYDFAWSTGVSGRKVVDYDFGALVYPKYIKVVSGSEVVNASVNFNEGGGSGNGSGSGESVVSMEYYAATKPISDITEIQSLLFISSHSAMLFNVNGAPENLLRVHPSALNYHMTESFPQCLVWRIAGTNLPIKNEAADEWIDTGSFASNYETYYGKPLSDSFRAITKEEFFDESYNMSDLQ